MSTQLILYPQYYQGFSSTANPSFNEFIVNGINFTGFNSTTLHNTTAVHPSQDTITNEHPYILGNWYRFTTTGGDYGAVTAPTYALGAVQLSHNAVTLGQTGLYQKLSGLIPGASYEVKISIVTPQAEILTFQMWDGTINYYQDSLSANTSTITTTFTAVTPNDIFLIYYEGIAANLSISKISILQSPQSPSLVYADLEDGQVICDLYQEEDIPLTLSIDDFKNVAEKVQSYSKDFNLPATKRNNQIFNDMYEITRSVVGTVIFNPYVKTKCVLKQDGFILFEGYLRLIDVKDKEGEISYNVNLYSEVVALADILKDKTFKELDFTELAHDYNKQEIKRSWNESPDASITYINPSTSGFRETYNTLRYPFIDWNHQYLVGGTGSGSAATAGNPELTSLEQAFRPCIQLKYLINKIFAETTQFNWTSDFFDSADFSKLYMDFNWGADNAPTTSSETVSAGYYIGYADNYAPNNSYGNLELTYPSGNLAQVNYNTTTNTITAIADNTEYNISYSYEIDILNVGGTVQYSTRWLLTRASGVTFEVDLIPIQTVTANTTKIYAGVLSEILNNGDTLEPQFYSSHVSINSIVQAYDGVSPQPLSTASVVINMSMLSVTSSTFLEALRGGLGQWEFLKGIMTMFNLITMVDESNPNNILIEPYGDVFIKNTNSTSPTTPADNSLAARSIQHDWTDKVDVSEMELIPLTDLNKNTVFKFVEDGEDYAFNVYKNATSGHLYGSKVWDASEFTILQGEEEIIAEPFAATVSKPIDDDFPNFIIPSLYAMSDDTTSEGFDNSPRIFYNNGIKSTGASYYIPAQNGLSSENQPDFLQFSHFSTIPSVSATTTDFVFESQQLLLAVGAPPTDNLFSIYWQPYFNELYSPDTRTMTLKVNLSPSDVASFKFYDTVFIKNRVFRVNKIDYKPNELATVEFILIP